MPAEHTPDGRYIVVDGRRWRATDPAIPEALRAELVGALMAARRSVGSGGSRSHVQDAKVALGERGEPWWKTHTPEGLALRVASTTRALLRIRGAAGSVSPTELARVVGGARWRAVRDEVRSALAQLTAQDSVRTLQGGNEVDPVAAGGRLTIRRGSSWPD